MGTLFLVFVAIFVAGVALRRPWLRRDMVSGAVFSLPFLLIQPLLGGSWKLSFTDSALSEWGLRFAWVVLVGSLAAALYTRFVHVHLKLVVHARRGLMIWLLLGPALAIGLITIARVSFLTAVGIALGFQLVLVVLLWRKLLADAITSMSGLALLYLIFYFILGQVLTVSGPESGIFFYKYPLEDILRVLAFGALWGPPLAAVRALTRGDTPFVSHRQIPRTATAAISFVILLIGGAWVYLQFVKIPEVLAATGESGYIEHLAESVSVQFSQPIDKESITVSITPEVKGNISFEDSYLQRSLVRRIVFSPETHFTPDTKYVVSIASVKSVLGASEGIYTYEFKTPALPTVQSTTPKTESTDVAICDPITVTLTSPVTELTEFIFALTPEAAYTIDTTEDKRGYLIKPKDCFAQSQTYTLTTSRRLLVYDTAKNLLSTEEPSVVSTTTFTTKSAPGIVSVAPQGGGVYTSTKDLTIVFSEPMEQADLNSILSFEPALSGSWTWLDAKTARFAMSSTLPYQTKYILKLNQGLRDQRGGFLPTGELSNFTTIGHVAVSSISPYKGSVGVKQSATIAITFDQPVDKSSAESRFSLSPAADGSFSWSGNTLQYKASLAKDTSYEVKMAAGVVSLVGLNLANTFTSTFKTEETVTQLNIPLYYQKYSLSCEIASLKMALNYKGVSVSEDEIYSKMPQFGAARSSGNIWGDPDKEFVGNINGRQNSSGYGVYAAPIATVANKYRTAKQTTGWSINDLARAIADGNPVVIWGTQSPGRKDSWMTAEGKVVNAYVGEHARTLIGFVGSVENPTYFIINDPINGRLKWSASQLKSNWGALWNMGVVVY